MTAADRRELALLRSLPEGSQSAATLWRMHETGLIPEPRCPRPAPVGRPVAAEAVRKCAAGCGTLLAGRADRRTCSPRRKSACSG
jgi:hypothetical protein